MLCSDGARNENLEVLVYFLKAKSIRKMGIIYIDNVSMKFRNKTKFRYGTPAYANLFQALITANYQTDKV
jgi:hypothetical protein